MSVLDGKTASDLAWPELLEQLARRAATVRGAEACRALALLEHPAEARERIASVAEVRELGALGTAMSFGGLEDIRDQVSRADKGGELSGPELHAVGQSVAGAARLRRHLIGNAGPAPRLAAMAHAIQELSHVHGPILDSVDDGGRLHDHASGALGPLRRRVAELGEQLARRARTLVDDPGYAGLLSDRFYTQREERYVLPVRADARGRVKGIVHGASQSGQTVFVEPEELVDLNNRLKLAETEVADEERRILAELTSYVREAAAEIELGQTTCVALDLLHAAGRLADDLEATAPELDGGGRLELPRARHPLMALSPRTCVPSDLALAPGATLVISGPNAGGKTVALKTAGLCALMARSGLHLPCAPGARIPFYRQVLSDIGDDQSLERNLSSFSAHLTRVRELLAVADAQTLVLLDEMAVGTEPEQGAALAQAVLEALAARGAQVMVTTHYERLKALAAGTEASKAEPAGDPRFVNASVGFDLTRLAPTFELHIGLPGSSGALLLARRLGLPAEVQTRAEALMGAGRASLDGIMVALAEERRKVEAERRALDQERRATALARREAEAAHGEADRRVRELRKGAHDEVVAELRRARDDLSRARKLARQLERDGRIVTADAGSLIAAAAATVQQLAPPPGAPGGQAIGDTPVVAGLTVLVPSLNQRGQVVSAPERGKVTVQIGALKTMMAVSDLRLPGPEAAKAPPAVARRRPAPDPATARTRQALAGRSAEQKLAHGASPAELEPGNDLAPARTRDATCDLRGERVDDALGALDRFIDDALLAEREVIFVIHGHGTGALRQAVRQHLKSHASVEQSRAGGPREGGDGITIAWLR
jgi:DNA mismatch repair protein MutS2